MFAKIIQLLLALPQLIDLIKAAIKAVKSAVVDRKEKKRQESAQEAADKLKKAQEAGDVKAQEDALSGVVDDYNK